jgi:hypothetical protein
MGPVEMAFVPGGAAAPEIVGLSPGGREAVEEVDLLDVRQEQIGMGAQDIVGQVVPAFSAPMIRKSGRNSAPPPLVGACSRR